MVVRDVVGRVVGVAGVVGLVGVVGVVVVVVAVLVVVEGAPDDAASPPGPSAGT